VIPDNVVPISKQRLESLVVAKFAAERTVRQLRHQNRLQRDLLRSALLELARERDVDPKRFYRSWVAERNGGSGYV